MAAKNGRGQKNRREEVGRWWKRREEDIRWRNMRE